MIFAKGLDTIEIVSTVESGSHKQGPLKLDIDLLSEAQTVHVGPRHVGEGLTDTITTSGKAFASLWLGSAKNYEPKPKRVLFLPPNVDHRVDCFCREKWPGHCRRCNGVTRTFVTDEAAAKLRSVRPIWIKEHVERNEDGKLDSMVPLV